MMTVDQIVLLVVRIVPLQGAVGTCFVVFFGRRLVACLIGCALQRHVN